MADEKEEKTNELVEAATSWEETPGNSFEEYQRDNWDKLFDGDILEGYQGSSKCKAISSIVSIEKLAKEEDGKDDYGPIEEANALFEDYKKSRVSQRGKKFDFEEADRLGFVTADTPYERRRFVRSIYKDKKVGGKYGDKDKERTCKAIADIAYERYRAGELFDELVLEPLSEAIKEEGTEAIKCAKRLQKGATTLSNLLEKFKAESYSATDGIFKDGPSAARILEGVTDFNPPHTGNSKGQDPLLAAAGFDDKKKIVPEYLKYSAGAARRPPVIMYGTSYDDKEARAENLIMPDMIYIDNNGAPQAYAANGTQITYPVGTVAGNEIDDFPYYWSSVVARMYTCAMKVAAAASTNSFTKEGIAKLESGQAAASSLDELFKDNHGNGAFGETVQFTAKEDRGTTLYDRLNVGSISEAPANSKIRTIISQAKQSDLTDEQLEGILDPPDGGGEEYTLSGWCAQVIEAANLIENYAWADVEVEEGIITRFKAAATWLRIAAEAIRQVADQMAKDSECILEADEELAEEAQSLEEEFKDQLGNNVSTIDVPFWFDKKVADLTRDSEIAAEDLDRDDLSKLDEILDTNPARALFKEQCFLLTYIGYFSNYKKNTLDAIDKDGNPKKPITDRGLGSSQGGGIHKRLPYTSLLAETGIPMPIGARASATDKNASLMIDGDPYGFINKLTQSPSYGDLFDIDHWHLSSLQPKIRLFKVVYENDDEGNPIEKETEISFESHFSKRELDLFKNRRSRGAGVGLKSFEFTYDGSNPFAAKKSIKANLKIFASTFSELFEDRDGTNNTKYKYVDLALKTFTKEKNPDEYDSWKAIVDENEKLAKLNFRLKALVGWTSPPGRIPDDLHSSYSNAGLKAALADSFVTLNLTPTVHNFEFDEQGRVIMNINYLAYVEDFFDQTAFNVYADPTPGFQNIGFIREKRKLQMKALRSKCDYDDAGADDTTLEDLEKEYAESVDKEISESIQKIIGTLMGDDKVYFVNVDMTEVSKHTTLGPYVDIEEVTSSILIDEAGAEGVLGGPLDRSIKKALESLGDPDDPDGKIAAALAASNPYHYNLGFFYISDLIDTVLGNIESELTVVSEQFKNLNELEYVEDIELKRRKANLLKFKQNFKRLRILLGPVEFIEYKRTSGNRKNSSFVNFGDIPVSVKYFVEFLADRSLSREDSFYSLTSFLNDLFNNLITNFLNNKKCFAFSAAQRVRVNQSTITSFNDTDKPDEITSLILEKANNIKGKRSGNPARLSLNDTVTKEHLKQGRPILNISGRGTTRKYIPIDKETNYFTFFAGRVQPVERMNGDKAEDHQNGIFHYLLGRDRGLVKNISLSKTETPGLQEVRFEQEGYEGLEQLRVVYDADIECYSNVNTFPGTYIYIDPKGFDPSLTENFDITKYGVGGYYMIIKSTHKFAAGEAKSKIYAKWVAQLQTSYPVESAGSIGSNTETGSARGCKEAKERLSALQNSDEG
jgi:hypothetical protein